MKQVHLFRAWGALVGLSLLSTLAALWPFSGDLRAPSGVAILLFAVVKARIILSQYLGLAQAPFWRHGFNGALTLYGLVLLGLYRAPWLAA